MSSESTFEKVLTKTYIGTKIVKAMPMTESVAEANGLIRGESKGRQGYKVQYKNPDGSIYDSWSPKDVFEATYSKYNGLSFGGAIEAMKCGSKVRRKGWNGRGIHIEIQNPDENSKMTHPYIFIDTTGLKTNNPDAPKDRVPWLASQTDMLSMDWEVVE